MDTDQYRKKIRHITGFWFKHAKNVQVIAVQEIENRQVLIDLGQQLGQLNGSSYQAVMLQADPENAHNLGFLVDLTLHLQEQSSLFKHIDLPQSRLALFSRAPLRIKLCQEPGSTHCLEIINLHLRSMRGLNSSRQDFVRKKRFHQSEVLARWVAQSGATRPLMLVGDFNALIPSDSHVDVLGAIQGNPDPIRPALRHNDEFDPDLHNLIQRLPLSQQVSYRYRGQPQVLDYLLASDPVASRLKQIRFTPINRKISDHAALMADFCW